jgi:hypothetical protein
MSSSRSSSSKPSRGRRGTSARRPRGLGVSRPPLHDLLDKHAIDGRLLRRTANLDDM